MITKYDDLIDSRDVIEALEDDDLDAETRAALEALAKEGENYATDWPYGDVDFDGVTYLIR